MNARQRRKARRSDERARLAYRRKLIESARSIEAIVNRKLLDEFARIESESFFWGSSEPLDVRPQEK